MLWNDVVMASLIFQKNSQKVEFCKIFLLSLQRESYI